MPQGPPICIELAIRNLNPAIPARGFLPRETGIRNLGALATEVQKQQKSAIALGGARAHRTDGRDTMS